jgi:hypothetical protein
VIAFEELIKILAGEPRVDSYAGGVRQYKYVPLSRSAPLPASMIK